MDAKQVLLKYWGYSSFRPLQEEIIQSVLTGRDTLALLPTGGGKSVCFQVPALMRDGLCIVVTPLIALMKDQVGNIKKKGVKAAAIYSGMASDEINAAIDNCIYGHYKFLYLSPERLETERIRINLDKFRVSLLAIDEAHCISQWGYDFRPTYLRIADIRQHLPGVPVLALTASATSEVVSDIQEKLLFRQPNLFRASFHRENIDYMVLPEENKLQRVLSIVSKINGSGIIYARSRKKTADISLFLKKNKVSADHYHAGLDPEVRAKKQESWMQGRHRVMVATNAFGMGIDKPDVRFVLHVDIPDSLEAYYQEAGRAGRDGKKSYAVILYEKADITDLNAFFENKYPPPDEIRKIYQSLGNYYQLATGSGEGCGFDFIISDFCRQYGFSKITVYNSLKLLEKDGYLTLHEVFDTESRVRVTLKKDDLYKFQVENPDQDHIIKTILRSYTGLFSDYQKISEADLSRRMEMKQEDVTALLKQLHKLGVIAYVMKKTKPQIVFTRERFDIRNLRISPAVYKERKDADRKRLDSVISYITSGTKCRSRQILFYFGETHAKRCGRCDVCLKINKAELSERDFEKISEQLLKALEKGPISISEIMQDFNEKEEDKVIRTVQWMIDNNQVGYTSDGKIKSID
ncbi:MAG: RecQ family ATP-dependent DNA helicase [Bacteroidales bacterium]|nr:RecQ family ATP-dependent DNA helicase [Bacteroidales bacterium]